MLRFCFLGHAIHTVLATAQILLPSLTNRYLMLPGRSCASKQLPIVTTFVHVMAAQFRLVWILLPAAYQLLPDFTMVPIWLYPARAAPLPGPTSGTRHNTQYGDYVLCDVIIC